MKNYTTFRRLILLISFFCISTGLAYSQSNQIKGKVTTADTGEPLPGANIVLKGTTNGTSTDIKGEYTLTVPSLEDTLVVSYIGFKQKLIPINGRTVINIKLSEQVVSG